MIENSQITCKPKTTVESLKSQIAEIQKSYYKAITYIADLENSLDKFRFEIELLDSTLLTKKCIVKSLIY